VTRVLVTGGAGYIGSHGCKALAAAGFEPITYDNLVYGHEWAVKWGPLERGDILDRARLDEVMAKYRPAAVVHFAAFAYVGESVADPAKYYRNNVLGTLALLDAMRDHEIRRLVFSSSCATYGTPARVPIREEDPQNPINPYGATKLMVERMLADYGPAYGLESVALRYFNAAGADPDGEVGEDHDPETHLIPLVLDAAAGVRPHVTVFGNDYDTPDGTCVRDYVHVADIAGAHVLALRGLERGGLRRAYNLATGVGVSVAEVIAAAEQVTGRKVPVVMGERRAGDPAVLLADPARAKADLGWTPTYPKIDQMIESAWAWQEARGKLPTAPAARGMASGAT
jgi:UDP-arabinose 4-epimerase